MLYTYHDEDYGNVNPEYVFVYGTSDLGDLRLGLGNIARTKHGAPYGRPIGYVNNVGGGKSFGIPLKDKDNYDIRTNDILRNVDTFLSFSVQAPFETFYITDITKLMPRISPEVLMYMFKGAHTNCIFPSSWSKVMEPPVKKPKS